MDTPVLFMTFNRPEHARRVFAEIRKARPKTLLLVSDGARADRPGEFEKVAAVRRLVEEVDWDCKVLKNYSDVNLGCGRRVSSGLIWGFENVEELIMLEDDTLPHPSFFRFCEELLDRFRADERVMHISGNRLNSTPPDPEYSYYFSRYDHVWGYATWRRAFRHYDFEIKTWAKLRDTTWLEDVLDDPVSAAWWKTYFDLVAQGDRTTYDSYDAQWVYAIWLQHGLSITPAVNLVTNIGWGQGATHTSGTDSPMSNLPLLEMEFPLRHPPYLIADREHDLASFEVACTPGGRPGTTDWLRQRLPKPVRRAVRRLMRDGNAGPNPSTA